MSQLCACGCGNPIPEKRRQRPTRYISGHQFAYRPKPEEIPDGFCECGCGNATGIATTTDRKRRHFRGYPVPRLRGHGDRVYTRTGKSWEAKGYRMVYAPDHPNADAKGCLPEHVLVATQKIGRPLADGEEVHHLNRDRSDNSPENLAVLSKADHGAAHTERLEKMWAAMTPEMLSEAGKKGARARWSKC